MMFPSLTHYLWCLLPLASGTVLVPMPIPALLNDRGPYPTHIKAREAIGVSNATATTTIVTPPSTITPAPTGWPSYSRLWPSPGCSVGTVKSDWCAVRADTVQLHYWPTSGNATYPSTYYMPQYSITMTSPSVYYVINKVSATDFCTQKLGPVQSTYIYSANLWEVSTLPPYASDGASTRDGFPTQLYLNDLRTDCATTTKANKWNFNTVNDPCHPILEFTEDLKNHAANGAWSSCVLFDHGILGIWDPPVPIKACTGEDCGNVVATSDTTTTEATPSATPQPDLETSTSSSVAVKPAPVVTPVAQDTSTPATTTIESNTPSPDSVEKAVATEASKSPSNDGSPGLVTTLPTSDESTPTIPAISSTSNPAANGLTTEQALGPATPSAIATLANSMVISASGSKVIVGSQTLTVGASSIAISGGNIINVKPTEVVVSNSDNGAVTTYPIPAIQAQPTQATVHSITVSALGSSAAIIADQAITLGGPAATLSGAQVVSLGSSGIVLQAPNGVVTTISVPLSTAVVVPITATTSETNAADFTDEATPSPATNPPLNGELVTSKENIPATSSTSGYATTASSGLGGIIYSTFEGAGQTNAVLNILGCLLCVALCALGTTF